MVVTRSASKTNKSLLVELPLAKAARTKKNMMDKLDGMTNDDVLKQLYDELKINSKKIKDMIKNNNMIMEKFTKTYNICKSKFVQCPRDCDYKIIDVMTENDDLNNPTYVYECRKCRSNYKILTRIYVDHGCWETRLTYKYI
jgi:hypothetical protein